jgi:phosphoribosylglycinamide formyltransferase 1
LIDGELQPAPLRIAVLLSGAGSTLRAIIAAKLNIQIAVVISDQHGAAGLMLAQTEGLNAVCVQRRNYTTKDAFEAAITHALDAIDPDIILLAGFMRVLSAEFVRRYAGRMINLHPSLLPKYPGLDTHARAIIAGDAEHGASVHWVTAELDGGPIIAQVRTPILMGDTPEALSGRLKPLEHALVVSVLRTFAMRVKPNH